MSSSTPSSAEPEAPKTRLYNPYQYLQVPIKNLYNLPTSPAYLFHEEALKPHRSWGENLQHYTGSGYLAGAIAGGAKGTLDGIRATEPGDTLKLRVNRVLNSGGWTGDKPFDSRGSSSWPEHVGKFLSALEVVLWQFTILVQHYFEGSGKQL